MALINQSRLRQYLKLNYNVLFVGAHGVGKTSIVKKTFEEAGLKWKFFSCATMDPWTDLVGVPKIVSENGTDVLDLVRPRHLQSDEVEAIFFDEFNRAPSLKIINAVMELLQFKSINGHRFKNLRVIWAAINPDDDEGTYAVNKLDPAHEDRFHAKIAVPFKVDKDYFLEKYPTTGQIFIDWWNAIPNEIRPSVSPRRLDYAAEAHLNDCRLEDFLPRESNPKKLRDMLKNLPYHDMLAKISSTDEAKAFLMSVNNATAVLDMVRDGDQASIDFFTKYGKDLPKELVTPVAEYVAAFKQGMTVASSMEEFIEKLPPEGDQVFASAVNSFDFNSIYSAVTNPAGSPENDLRAINMQKPHLIYKLASRISDVLTKCTSKTLMRILWVDADAKSRVSTNFYKMALLVNKVDGKVFTTSSKQFINKKLYQNKIVDQMYFLA